MMWCTGLKYVCTDFDSRHVSKDEFHVSDSFFTIMKIPTLLLSFALLAPAVQSILVVPVLVASHLLVKDLKKELEHDNSKIHKVTPVTNMLKKMVTECSSDVYLIVNQPGLKYTDIQDSKKELWPFIQKYLHMASTVVGLPRVAEPLDLDFLESYIIKTCDAETINVIDEDEHEVKKYIDIRKRVIRVELSPLPEDDEGVRDQVLRNHDELVRKILRKVPSPHYSIILTSTTTSSIHPIPPVVIQHNPAPHEIFDEIVNSPMRKEEVERNDRFKQAKPDWNEDKNTINRYLRNRKKDEVHLFRNNEFWKQREKLVTTFAVMIMSLFMLQIWKFSRSFTSVEQKQKQKLQ